MDSLLNEYDPKPCCGCGVEVLVFSHHRGKCGVPRRQTYDPKAHKSGNYAFCPDCTKKLTRENVIRLICVGINKIFTRGCAFYFEYEQLRHANYPQFYPVLAAEILTNKSNILAKRDVTDFAKYFVQRLNYLLCRDWVMGTRPHNFYDKLHAAIEEISGGKATKVAVNE